MTAGCRAASAAVGSMGGWHRCVAAWEGGPASDAYEYTATIRFLKVA